jgi:DNA-binding MarR family transcriptional regulator
VRILVQEENILGQPLVIARMTIVSLTWKRYLQRVLVPYDITLKQAYVLRELVSRDFLYPAQLANMLFCDRPTATVIVRNMERQGWVAREKDAQNRKYVRLRITEAGKEKLAELAQSLVSETLFDPLACFSEEEVKELERLFGKLSKHFKKIGPEIT